MTNHDDVLRFWYGTAPQDAGWEPDFRDEWFNGDAAFDRAIEKALGDTYERAAGGALDSWQETPHGALALVLLLDQVPRNMFRGTAQAFATDSKALGVARYAVSEGFDRTLPKNGRLFLYLPFEHSEDLGAQEESVRLFASLDDDFLLGFARDHHEVVARFGRFPHRNAALGRESTPAEKAYLKAEAVGHDWANG